VQLSAFDDLDPADRSVAPDASHRLVSRLVTQVDSFLEEISTTAQPKLCQHFFLVGEDLHILLGILLGFVENESQYSSQNKDSQTEAAQKEDHQMAPGNTWASALSSDPPILSLTYRHGNFLVKIDRVFIAAVLSYKNIDSENCKSLRDRLISILVLLATYSNPCSLQCII